MGDGLRDAARLVWASINGLTLDDDARALLAAGVGGVVLFSRNVASPEQLRSLCAEIRATAMLTSRPFGVKRRSALSVRKSSRYSARDVNMRYGSRQPFVTRSSTMMPR